ncbi:MAG: signal peptide peptidase SppA [Bacteroidetes bacterium]|nr:signal peptide peptidase SppA [Bacteroidota bacterium]
MKGFFKFMLASMLGTFLTIVILFFILLGIAASIISFSTNDEVKIAQNSVLQINLDKQVYDRSPKFPFFFDNNKQMGLSEILKNIHKAKNDAYIKAIYLNINYIPTGLSTIDEIRNALLDFKKSGKPIYSYSEYYTQSAYYLATVSDKIFLHPEGMILFKGINAEMLFLKGTLDKLDIKMQVIRHGKFKAATEPLFLQKMSPENREQITALIHHLWDKMLLGISAARNLHIERLNEIADSLSAQAPEDALKYKLVDGLVYKDEFLKEVKQMLRLPDNKEISLVTMEKYSNVSEKNRKKVIETPKIAVIYASGDIVNGNGDDQNVGSEKFSKAIRKAREDSKIKAIVLRVNSPGGSSLASDVIWREVMLASKVKPVVASFGNVAASGGYYIACPATRIIADPTCITGSIGVFAVIPDLKGFFNTKLGMTFDNAKTNANSEFITINSPLPGYQEFILQKEVEKTYASFVSKVAEGRHMTKDKVDSIGQGRVWSAIDAKKIGLVDDFGGLEKAIEEAAKLANIKDYRSISLPEQKDQLEQLIDMLTGNDVSKVLEKELGENARYLNYLKQIRDMKGVQARLPYDLIIN